MRRKTPLLFGLVALTTVAVDCRSLREAAGDVERLSGATRAALIAHSGAMRVEVAPPTPAAPEPVDLPPVPLEKPRPRPTPKLASIARETWVLAEPRWKSRRLGYLRAGARIERDAEPSGHSGCKGGWYAVRPSGYVCAGSRASLDPHHPVALLSARRPNLHGLPYTYVTSRHPTPTMYARLPTLAEQQRAEQALHYYLRRHAIHARSHDFVRFPEPDEVPPLLRDGGLVPGLAEERRGPRQVVLGQARVRSGFALLASYEHEGRRFGLTTDMALIPLDRSRVVRPSRFQGVVLSDELTLPVAFVRRRIAQRYEIQPSGALAAAGHLVRRSVVALTGRSRRVQGMLLHEARDGGWLAAEALVRLDRFKQAPGWARAGKKWVDVSLLQQSLVAYEGKRPVYATLVSTGADGIKDHQGSHATIQGTFLIHTKHVTVTMDGDEQGDEFDLRDVPFVQYFTEGYALHGAYWHDDFGVPRSHGCVNLSPLDAAYLFGWTDPKVPAGWHASLAPRSGTVVHIHP